MKAFCVAVSIVLVACGGDVFVSPDSGTDGAPPNDGSSGNDGSGNDGGVSPGCPTSAPTSGTACITTSAGPKCEYGSNPDPNCNRMFMCVSDAWVEQTSGTICPPQSDCPATYAAVPSGQDCSPEQLSCAYPQGECICTTSFGGLQKTTPAWDCIPAVSGCPSPRPDIGTACTTPNMQCDYGACSGGVAVTCTDGAWVQTITPCPG